MTLLLFLILHAFSKHFTSGLIFLQISFIFLVLAGFSHSFCNKSKVISNLILYGLKLLLNNIFLISELFISIPQLDGFLICIFNLVILIKLSIDILHFLLTK